MTQTEDIWDFIYQFPGRDDDEIAAALKIPHRQAVNIACRSLEKKGVIHRRVGDRGKIANYPVGLTQRRSDNAKATVIVQANLNATAKTKSVLATDEWHWEGNVVAALARHLRETGWEIVNVADTASKERGPDIEARKAGRSLLVEAKGYPSKSYRDSRRAGEHKPTNPALQARLWYSHALLKGMQMRGRYPQYLISLALPDFPVYEKLFTETAFGLKLLNVGLFKIRKDGIVYTWGLDW